MTPSARRSALVALVAVVGLLLGGGLAWAAWTSSGPGSSTGRGGTLSQPTSGSIGAASCTSTSTADVPLTYGAVSNATGYLVQWSDSSTFTNPTSISTTATSVTLRITGASAAKTIYIRTLPTAGNWIAPGTQSATANVGPCGSTCTAGSTTVNANADSWIDEADIQSNHGTETNLFVSSLSSGERRTLVKFALPALPTGCSLDSATLSLRDNSGVSGRTILASRNTSDWTETGVTWANRPSSTDSVSSAAPASFPATQQWTVTAQVQAQYAGPNYGFLIRDQSPDGTPARTQTYLARQNSRPPQLIVTYS